MTIRGLVDYVAVMRVNRERELKDSVEYYGTSVHKMFSW
jgi:hypothetical protein